MKMNTGRILNIVDEPHNRSSPGSCADGRPRDLAIVSLQVCDPAVGINLLGKIFDGHFIEIKNLASSSICIGRQWLQLAWDNQRVLCKDVITNQSCVNNARVMGGDSYGKSDCRQDSPSHHHHV